MEQLVGNCTDSIKKAVFLASIFDEDGIEIDSCCELNFKKTFQLIKNGFSIGSLFQSKKRNKHNFIGTEHIAIKIQSGVSLKEFIAKNWVKNIGGMLFLRSPKTEPCDDLIWLIGLPRRISNTEELRSLSRALISYLEFKIEVCDEFYILKPEEIYQSYLISPVAISNEAVDFLIKDGERDLITDTVANASFTAATISAAKLKYSQIFKTTLGDELRLDEISKKTYVICPIHENQKHFSFVNRNNVGKAYHYCDECKKTRWEDGGAAGVFSSDAFEDQLLSLVDKSRMIDLKRNTQGGLQPFIEDYPLPVIKTINIQDKPKLEIIDIPEGLTLVKSGKGTGKTEAIGKIAKSIKIKNSKSRDVLLIGHRQSLIQNLCGRMGLDCYLNDAQTGSNKQKYGVCLDSLMKIQDSDYELIIIDEVEQVLAHFLSETMADSALKIFKQFERLIRNAKKVVVMDADLGWTTFLTLSSMRLATNNNSSSINFIINTWKPKNKSINLYANKDHLIGALIEKLEQGKKVFVTSNSKAEIFRLENGIKKYWSDAGRVELKIMTVTSDNSAKPEVRNFIEFIKDEILKFDLVLTSPSMSTGVDISFNSDESKIDSVFGIFETRINIHTEIDQQISRVRNPREISVWISPARYNFETQFEVVRSDSLRNKLANVVVSLEDILGGIDLRQISSDYLTLATLVTIGRRSSINSLRSNFWEYKSRQGVYVHWVKKNDALSEEGADLSEWGKRLSKIAFQQSIINAVDITEEQYFEYQNLIKNQSDYFSVEEKKSAYKHALEWFYLQPVSVEILELDDQGKYRVKMRRFHKLTHPYLLRQSSKSTAMAMELVGRQWLSIKKVADSDLHFLKYLFLNCPFYKRNKFNLNCVFSSNDLKDFANTCIKFKRLIEGNFDFVVRSDIRIKPISQLKQFLRYVGIDIVKNGKQVSGNVKTYFYKLDPLAISIANEISNLIEIRNEYTWDD